MYCNWNVSRFLLLVLDYSFETLRSKRRIHKTFYSVLCDDAGLMAQWSAADDTIDHHLIVITLSHVSLHFVTTPSSSHCRVISASVMYRHHHHTIARLSSHYRAIASSTQICSDSLGSIRIPGIFLKIFFWQKHFTFSFSFKLSLQVMCVHQSTNKFLYI